MAQFVFLFLFVHAFIYAIPKNPMQILSLCLVLIGQVWEIDTD
jgi:hypothetical protein